MGEEREGKWVFSLPEIRVFCRDWGIGPQTVVMDELSMTSGLGPWNGALPSRSTCRPLHNDHALPPSPFSGSQRDPRLCSARLRERSARRCRSFGSASPRYCRGWGYRGSQQQQVSRSRDEDRCPGVWTSPLKPIAKQLTTYPLRRGDPALTRSSSPSWARPTSGWWSSARKA